ncbi:MAG: HAMP domain-containing histidine kinase [Eubacterium sp.]|nr:HAMP domain-containing histidine kinase [Eubacterium sp.]
MKKLKKKVFLVIFLILTLVATGAVALYNIQLYQQEQVMVERALNSAFEFGMKNSFNDKDDNTLPPKADGELEAPPENGEPEFNREAFGNMRFLDSTVYTVCLTEDGAVDFIINHSPSESTEEDIDAVATALLAENCDSKIGNLYTEPYAYSRQGNTLVIVENSETNALLRRTLLVSLLLWLVAVAVIVLLALLLTRWIARPVAESFDKQKQFIADASHELKTPLAVIIASADALESNPAEAKWLENIKSESDRMSKLIADLLELAKSESVNDKEQYAEGNLSKLVEKATLTFESVMFEKGIALEDSIDEGILLNMNSYKIQQLLSILLDNAVKHSEPGGQITVSLKKEKDIILKVTNRGEGIPAGEEEKIFERFYRADESRNRNENRYGLGLAIAKNICAAHRAEISAKSENGLTTFKVVFKQK